MLKLSAIQYDEHVAMSQLHRDTAIITGYARGSRVCVSQAVEYVNHGCVLAQGQQQFAAWNNGRWFASLSNINSTVGRVSQHAKFLQTATRSGALADLSIETVRDLVLKVAFHRIFPAEIKELDWFSY